MKSTVICAVQRIFIFSLKENVVSDGAAGKSFMGQVFSLRVEMPVKMSTYIKEPWV